LFQHPEGVQALAAVGGQVAVADFDGRVHLYEGASSVRSWPVEPIVRLVKLMGNHLVVVGLHKLYQISLRDASVLTDDSFLSGANTVAVCDDGLFPAIVDEQGHGGWIDGELTPRGTFRTSPGSYPVSADDGMAWCVLHNADGTYALLAHEGSSRQRRIVRTFPGAAAVSRDGKLLAVSERHGVRIVRPAEFVTPA
jgi:hypothetical protein